MVYFEYDEEKSRFNKDKHGIDFEQAQALWEDDDLISLASAYADEWREMLTGRIHGKCYTAVITLRGENIRIISVRRARKEEELRYEKQKENR